MTAVHSGSEDEKKIKGKNNPGRPENNKERERRERERKVVLFIIHAPHQGRARTFADDDITTGFFFA